MITDFREEVKRKLEVNEVLSDRNLIKWVNDGWMHRLVAYGVVVITLSLLVQIITTIMIGRL